MDVLTPEQLMAMMLDAIGEMDRAQAVYDEAGDIEAETEEIHAKALASAYERSAERSFTTAKHRDAWVDAEASSAKMEYTRAKNRVKALNHAVQNARQKVSAMQSMNKTRQEYAAFERVGPEGLNEAAHKVMAERF